MNTDSVDWSAVDWDGLLCRLHRRTAFLAGHAPDVFNCGVSIDDVLQEVFLAFFCSTNQLGWNPQKASLDAFLRGVAKHKFIGQVRRGKKITHSVDDPQFVDRPDTADTAFARFIE